MHLFLICSLRIYPFIDLPYRLATSTILRYYHDATNEFSQYYKPELSFQPNLLHMLFTSLKIFPSVEFGNKVFYCIYVVILPLSLLFLIKKLGGNVWFALLSFLILYNYNLIWGFAEYIICIPLIFFFIYFLLNYLQNEYKRSNKALIVILLFLMFFIHIIATLFALFIFLILCFIEHKHSCTKLISDVLLIIPIVSLILIWWIVFTEKSELDLFDYLVTYYKNFGTKFIIKCEELMTLDNFSLLAGKPGKLIAFFFSLVLISPIIPGIFEYTKNKMNIVNNEKYKLIIIIVLCSLFCFFFLPSGIPGFSFLYQRFSVFFFTSIICLNSLLFAKKLHNKSKYIIIIACLLHFILWLDYFKDFERENYNFDKDIFPENSKGKRLASLIYEYQFRGRPIYIHFPNYYITWHKGIATTTLIGYRFYPIRRVADEEKLPDYNEWVGRNRIYFGEYSNMDYILVRGTIPENKLKYFSKFELYKSRSNWFLYKKRL